MKTFFFLLKYLGKGLFLVSMVMAGTILAALYQGTQDSDLTGEKLFVIIACLTSILTPIAAFILYYCDLWLEAIERRKNRLH